MSGTPRRLVRSACVLGASSLAVTGGLLGVLSSPARASAAGSGLGITEVAPWASGNSPYGADWFELTNFGSTALNPTGWMMDDNSNSFAASVPMSGITSIAPGESVIYAEQSSSTTPAAVIAGFRNYWTTMPASVQVGTYTGSGVGLSTSGDAVNIWTSAGGTPLASVTFGSSPSSAPFASFDNSSGADGTISTLSAAGNHGAQQVTPPGTASSTNASAIGGPGTIAGGTTTSPSPTGSASTSPSASPTPSGNLPWPGGPDITTVDNQDLTTQNLSGLIYKGSGTDGRLWAVDNGPSVLFKLQNVGGKWVPEPGGNWSAGKSLKYPDGTGDPDSEGVTIGGPTAASGIYVSTERDNSNNGVSKLAVLKYDENQTGSTISAQAQWDLTPAIPATGPNLGLEAIAYVPDSYLVANGLKDSSTGAAYDPSSYPNHGTGLFFVGVEGSGMEYGFALDQGGSTYHLVTQFTSGFTSIMENTFDADSGAFWAHCDNTCSNVSTVLRISPTTGTFAVVSRYDRPAGMAATMNNEGYAITPDTECVNGLKPVFFSDDGDTDGYSIRQGSLTCSALPTASLPEFTMASFALVAGFAAVGGVFLVRRRRTA